MRNSWVNNIPKNWKTEKIKYHLSKINRGFSPEYVYESSLKILNQACIYWDGIKSSNVKYQKEVSILNNKGLLNKGDIILNSTGTGTLGRAAVFDEDGIFIADSHVTIIRCNKTLSNWYLKYLIESDYFQKYIYLTCVSGSTNQIEFSGEKFKNLSIPIPDIRQQKIITNFLNRKIKLIDRVIKKKKKLINLLQEKRSALITHAVTKGLNLSAKMKPSGIDWIGDIPADWKLLPLFSVARENKKKNIKLKNKNLLSLSYGKIIRKNISSNYGLLPASFENYQVLKNGYIVLRLTDLQNDQKSLRVGFVSEPNGIITSAYTALIPQKINNEFLYYILHAYDILKVYYGIGGGVRQSIDYKKISKISISIPSQLEQKNIVAELNKINKLTDLSIKETSQSIVNFEEYRSSLIYHAVTGKIRV